MNTDYEARPPCGGDTGRGAAALLCAAALTLCAVAPERLWAQQVPNAGRLLQESTPQPQRPPAAAPRIESVPQPAATPPAPASSASFRLDGVRFRGNTVFGNEELAAYFRDRVGKQVNLRELEETAAQITKAYRDRGYFLAQALVPAQEIVGGVVEVSVVEGTLGKLRLVRAEGVSVDEPVIRRYLAAVRPGEPLTEQALERTMLLLSDLPGVSFQSTLEEGEEPGTVDLVIDVSEGRRFLSQVELDNFGLDSSGLYRLGGGVRIANPFGRGDNLDVRALVTSASHTVFGRISYETPIGGNGTRVGVGFSSLAYSLGAPFNELGAEGYARVLDASVLHPFRRTRTSTLLGMLQVQRKWVEDRYDAIGFTAPRDILDLVGGVTYDHRDQWLGGGFVNLGATLTLGNVDVGSTEARDLDSGPAGRNTEGSFTKLNFTLSRLQAVSGNWTLFGALAGQMASKNLDNAERMGLGGPRAVRAYSTGSLVADEGLVATAEVRYSLNPDLTLSLFYDHGWSRVNRDPIQSVTDNSPSIGGYGIGFFWGKARNFQIQGSVAWRSTDPIPGDTTEHTPMVYVQGVKFF